MHTRSLLLEQEEQRLRNLKLQDNITKHLNGNQDKTSLSPEKSPKKKKKRPKDELDAEEISAPAEEASTPLKGFDVLPEVVGKDRFYFGSIRKPRRVSEIIKGAKFEAKKFSQEQRLLEEASDELSLEEQEAPESVDYLGDAEADIRWTGSILGPKTAGPSDLTGLLGLAADSQRHDHLLGRAHEVQRSGAQGEQTRRYLEQLEIDTKASRTLQP
jgi:hypothetical protein